MPCDLIMYTISEKWVLELGEGGLALCGASLRAQGAGMVGAVY